MWGHLRATSFTGCPHNSEPHPGNLEATPKPPPQEIVPTAQSPIPAILGPPWSCLLQRVSPKIPIPGIWVSPEIPITFFKVQSSHLLQRVSLQPRASSLESWGHPRATSSTECPQEPRALSLESWGYTVPTAQPQELSWLQAHKAPQLWVLLWVEGGTGAHPSHKSLRTLDVPPWATPPA